MSLAYSVAQIRAAEQVLLDAQSEPDELMRQAAHAVAVAAGTMTVLDDAVLLLVGAGGNGGDALYAGAELALGGRKVDAVLLGREGRVQERARRAFREAGGRVLSGLPTGVRGYRLVIDGILGLGGSGGLGEELACWLDLAAACRLPFLAVDVPSGIDADTGALPEPVTTTLPDLTVGMDPAGRHDEKLLRVLPQHVSAEVTVTFGGLRLAHAVTAACGEVLLADIGLPGRRLSEGLLQGSLPEGPDVLLSRAVDSGVDWPEPLEVVRPVTNTESLEPRAEQDKYSGGVVGLCAGSGRYPGAAVLTATGAVRATSSMVRYVGPQGVEVVRALPEVVISDTLARTGRVQAWVVGPGRGTDAQAAEELAELLARPEPLLIDADALTLLAGSARLRARLRERGGATLLTPHVGEFRRLAASLAAELPDPDTDRLGAVRALGRELGCGVLLKGRHTVIFTPGSGTEISVVDAGSSWAATPGSGDVLAGIAGAWMARAVARTESFLSAHPNLADRVDPHLALYAVREAVQVQATAAWLSARTPDGPAPTSASRIADAVPQATARMSHHR